MGTPLSRICPLVGPWALLEITWRRASKTWEQTKKWILNQNLEEGKSNSRRNEELIEKPQGERVCPNPSSRALRSTHHRAPRATTILHFWQHFASQRQVFNGKGQFLKNDILVNDSALKKKTKTKENTATTTNRRPKTNRNTSRDTSLSMTPVLTLPTSFCRHVPGSTWMDYNI